MECNCGRLTVDNCSSLKDYLPEGYDYRICEYEEKQRDHFKVVIRLPLSSRDCVEEWFAKMQTKSCTTWRVHRTFVSTAESTNRKNHFRMDYRCQHNTRPRSTSADKRAGSKNTSCPGTVYLVTKHCGDKRGRIRSSDPHIKAGYLTKCTIRNYHNHEIRSADALRKRDVSETTKEKLLSLFKSGHCPSTALQTLKYDLQDEMNEEEYSLLSSDRSICPDSQYCYRLYYSFHKQENGEKSAEIPTINLESAVEAFNSDQGDVCASVGTTEDGQTVVVICSPVMKRIHTEWPSSAEMVFIDSSGTMGRRKSNKGRVFLLLTHSSVGGLPLGVMITTSESESTIKYGLELLKSVYPEGAFFGRGQQGPVNFMTDDVEAERLAIYSVYPSSSLLLCTSHVLQAAWRWILDSKHQIAKEDRLSLFHKVKSMMFAETVHQLQATYDDIRGCALCRKYPQFLQYVTHLYDRRELCALAYHSCLAVKNTNTNNYSEAAMRALKDQLLYRRKAYNFYQLVDFLLTRLPQYFQRKLTDASNNLLDGHALSSQFYPKDAKNPPESVRQINESDYEVKDQQQLVYQVNTDLGICSCLIGKTGAPCKHQGAVLEMFGNNLNNFLPVMSSELRSLFYKIATGRDNSNTAWLQPLRAGLAPVPTETGEATTHIQQEMDNATQSSDDDDGDIMDCNEPEDDVSLPSPSRDVPQAAQMVEVDGSEPQSPMVRQYELRSTSRHQDLKQKLDEIFTSLKYKLETNPEVFKIPIQSFISNYSKIHSRSRLVSALQNFGKRSGAIAARKICRKARYQSTSVARRKMHRDGSK